MNLLFRYPHLVILLFAYIIAELAVAGLSRSARSIGAVDRPGVSEYKTQVTAVPFLGGIGLFIGFIGAMVAGLNWQAIGQNGWSSFLASRETKVALATMVGGTVISILGMVDDFRSIHAVVKLIVLIVVTAVLTQFGVHVDLPLPEFFTFLITLAWIVGVVSAFNAIDNTDGVAGTTAVSASIWMFLVAWGTSAEDSQPGQTYLTLALVGATLGFLRHNRPPARVYLGNSGSFALGFFVSVLALTGHWTTDPLHSAVVPILLLSYPVFDLAYTVFMRWKKGIVRNPIEAIVVSGRDHTAHRLAALGLGPWGVLLIIGGVNCIAGGAAFAIVRYGHQPAVFYGAIAAVAAMYAIFGFGIRNAVDLHAPEARISHRVPTGTVKEAAGDAVTARRDAKPVIHAPSLRGEGATARQSTQRDSE